MNTFTFNTPSQQHIINTRQQARQAAKAISNVFGLVCTGADKKRVQGWSFDVAKSKVEEQQKKAIAVIKARRAKRQKYAVVGGSVVGLFIKSDKAVVAA